MSSSDNPPAQIKARLGPDGRIVIPAVLRQQLGLEPGVTLFLDVRGDVLEVESLPARIRRIQREFAPFRKPGVLASDELIAERRAEARREELELLQQVRPAPRNDEEKIA
jgi:bifunctional DNA-binding transcriptional regulator/antitoxin component of YhaV-PrlF toxin-antitoxin module